MTFTFNTNPFDDVGRIRFAIGDTDSTAQIFDDEVLNGLIAEKGDWKKAAVAAVENIITQLLIPNFQADWLKVEVDKALGGYERLLTRLRQDFGISLSGITLSVVQVARSDGDCTSTTEYT